MSTTQQRKQDREFDQHLSETLHALIEEQVLHRLGDPDGLHSLQVRRLWEDRYRVNVLIGESAASARIANSYFVELGSDGNIVESNPTITKLRSIR